ncbi:MAG: PrsW family intramembrane metalloprotease [Prevotella sp.]|nr:PrsW family intramembrane metalloprotease [Prevotella sp.]
MLILLALAILPSVLLMLYIYKKDSIPEPVPILRRAFIYGMVSCIPIIIVELFLMPFISIFGENVIGTTMKAFLGAALPEESFKLLALWLILRNNPYYDEHYDGIVYSVCVGLGFATVENIGYVLDNGVATALARAFLAVPLHYACAVLMGYYYSVYHFVDRSERVKWSILLVPILVHGIYDAIAFLQYIHPGVSSVIMMVLILFCVKVHQYCKKQIDKQLAKDDQDRQFREEDWEESQFT